MNLNEAFVADIEADGLLDEATVIHVMSVAYPDGEGGWGIMSTNDSDKIQGFVGNPDNIIVGHNFIPYDKPVLQKLGFTVNAFIIDTLALSWYLYSDMQKHGLEAWGELFGVPKPEISDWKNLSYEEYKHRCEEDVKINTNMWLKSLELLRELYDGDEEAVINVIKFANFKMENIRVQEENKILIDIPQCEKNLEYLEGIIEEKKQELMKVMPPVPKKATRKKPATMYKKSPTKPETMYKKDGNPTSAGQKWLDLCDEHDKPHDYDGEFEILSAAGQKWQNLLDRLPPETDKSQIEEIMEIVKYDDPNPSSNSQMKDFLLSLGWKPKIYKDGANGKVPQLRDEDKNLCSSIQELIKIKPELEALDGLSVAQHRAGYLKAFLEMADEDGYVTAGFNGFAKTWRFKHKKPIVNLPSNTSQYGELVRSVMIAPEGMLWANTDMSGLEDRCKQICIHPYDPEYVATMNVPGYDPHLAIALRANFMSQEDAEFFKWYKKKPEDGSLEGCPDKYIDMTNEQRTQAFVDLGDIRSSAKTANYSLTYGCGARKLAESADIPLKQAEALRNTYWDQNWSVKQFAEDQVVKNVDGRDWIYNPYSKLWLLLTSDHIKFSACNQNFGSKIFDLFLYFLMERGVKPIMTMHDELSWYIKEGEEKKYESIIEECIQLVNDCFDYPIKFESDPEFAKSYGGVH